MKVKALSLAVMLSFAASVSALAADAKPVEVPKTPEAIAATMWDFTRNPEYLKDPKKFVPWLSAALEPGFYTGLGMQMLDPGMWATMVNSMMHPGAYSAWMPLMTDPNIYMKWLTASMDPNFYNAVLSQFTDTGKMMRWATAPVDPKMLNLMFQSLNPNMYLKWMMSPLDPRWLQAMITPMNPNAYLGWMGTTLNPASYGDLWKGFLTPTIPAPTTTYTPGTTGYGTTVFNPFDPNAMAQLFAVPGQSAAGAPATQPYIFNPFDPNAWSKVWQVPGQPAPATQPAK